MDSFFNWLFGKKPEPEAPSVPVMEHSRKVDKVLASLESKSFARTESTKVSDSKVERKEFDEKLLEVRMKTEVEDKEDKERAKPKIVLED